MFSVVLYCCNSFLWKKWYELPSCRVGISSYQLNLIFYYWWRLKKGNIFDLFLVHCWTRRTKSLVFVNWQSGEKDVLITRELVHVQTLPNMMDSHKIKQEPEGRVQFSLNIPCICPRCSCPIWTLTVHNHKSFHCYLKCKRFNIVLKWCRRRGRTSYHKYKCV